MWGKLKKKLSQPELRDTRTTYDKHFSFDFSDGPPQIVPHYPMPLSWPDSFQDSRYPINSYTITPFIESLALENLVAPPRILTSPEIKIIPPTPPWITPFPSRRGSKEASPPREGLRADSPGHRKALSDTPLATAKARPDAMRRGREEAKASATASKAAISPALLNTTHRVINWSLPMRYNTPPPSLMPILTPRSTSLSRGKPDVPEDVDPYDGIEPSSPPFEFDD